jgi:hypothetical protein
MYEGKRRMVSGYKTICIYTMGVTISKCCILLLTGMVVRITGWLFAVPYCFALIVADLSSVNMVRFII